MNKDLKSKEDASPLTTSTDSENFDTWTVITDKPKDLIHEELPSPPPTPEKSDDDEIMEDAVQVEVLKASDDQLENRYTDVDDLSDGISIISECESVGRISPHPELRKHLSELNMRFVDVIQPNLRMTNSEGDSTLRSYEKSSDHSADTFRRIEPIVENNRRPRKASRQVANSDSTNFQPTTTLRTGLGLFYVGALLAVLAFISKFKYESVLGTNTDVLNQKIVDLELKNNLMRAEIDILAKQVNYLTTLSESQKYSSSNKQKINPSKDKKMKVWPGNGNTIDDVLITPNDLKTPYKCNADDTMDIAGNCVEPPKTEENILDSLGEKVRSVIDENDHFPNFEKIVDKVLKLTKNPFNEKDDKPIDILENDELNHIDYQKMDDYVPKEGKSYKLYKPANYDGKKYENKQESFKKHKSDESGESKERYRRDRSNEDFSGSGEKFKKSKDYKKYDKYSSSEYENAKRNADGQWHEKLMQHREKSRKNNDKHRHDKNWYIERGDSREQARVADQKYR